MFLFFICILLRHLCWRNIAAIDCNIFFFTHLHVVYIWDDTNAWYIRIFKDVINSIQRIFVCTMSCVVLHERSRQFWCTETLHLDTPVMLYVRNRLMSAASIPTNQDVSGPPLREWTGPSLFSRAERMMTHHGVKLCPLISLRVFPIQVGFRLARCSAISAKYCKGQRRPTPLDERFSWGKLSYIKLLYEALTWVYYSWEQRVLTILLSSISLSDMRQDMSQK